MVLNLNLGKKGIIFTIISSVISAIIISAFFFTQTTPLDAGVSSVKVRVNNINIYLNQIETYLAYQAGAQTKNATNTMIKIMISNDRYYSGHFEERLIQCLRTGVVPLPGGGPPIHSCGANLNQILTNLEDISLNQLNIDSDFEINSIKIYHSSPWTITTEVNFSIKVNDSYALWNYTKILQGNTSIIGMQDPTHIIDVVPPATPSDRRISTEIPFNGWIRYPSTLNRYRDTELYFQYDKAPSFLDRLNDDLSAETADYGISSIINVQGPVGSDISQLDYLFLRQKDCGGVGTIQFDFFSPLMNATERSLLGISENPAESIHLFSFPLEFVVMTNMSNTRYHNDNYICPP